MEAYDNRGLPITDNENGLKTLLIRISSTKAMGELENFRHKEMTEANLLPWEFEYCVEKIEIAFTDLECHYQAIEVVLDEMIEKNKVRKELGLPLFSLKKAFERLDKAGMRNCVMDSFSRVKNICQLSKSRDGFAVKTLLTHQVVNLNRQESQDFSQEKPKPLFGFLAPKKEEEKNNIENRGNYFGRY